MKKIDIVNGCNLDDMIGTLNLKDKIYDIIIELIKKDIEENHNPFKYFEFSPTIQITDGNIEILAVSLTPRGNKK